MMNDILNLKLIQPFFVSIIVYFVTKIFFKKKDERESLSFFKALKSTFIFILFIVGLFITYNLSNNIQTIEIIKIGWLLLASCVFFVISYLSNISTEFQFNFFSKLKNLKSKKILYIIRFIYLALAIFPNVLIIMSFKYNHIQGIHILVILAYISTWIAILLACNVEKIR